MRLGQIRIGSAAGVVAGALMFFAGAACLFIPKIGIEADEVLFVPPVYHYAAVGSVKIGRHQLPTMLMSYVGADKTWLLAAIIKAIPPSTWSLRLPAVLIGILSLWLLFATVRRLANDRVAAALVCLLATDPMFLLSTTMDWGPVALTHLFFIAALYFAAREKPMIFLASISLGLAFWDKGTAVWTLPGLFLCMLVFFPGVVRAHASLVNVAKALAGFAIGAWPFLRYNMLTHWATFRDNARFSTDGMPDKLRVMGVTLNGQGMFDWLVLGGTPLWYTLAPVGIAAAVILLFNRRVAPIGPLAHFALFTGLFTWISMLSAASGGTSIHHTILVWPWLPLFALCVLGYALNGKQFGIAVAAMAISNIVMIGLYAERARDYGPGPHWSDASFELPALIQSVPADRKIATIDWGIDLPAIFLTGGSRRIEDRTFLDTSSPDFVAEATGTQFLTRVAEEEVKTGNNAKFDAAIGKLGLVRRVDRVISDRHGRPFYVSFHCERP
jgi:4-amino-4-deoxy-L-arabinose transferase-like glycosyltransferase